jgi:hypothetical protein
MERYRSFSLAVALVAVGILALSATPARAQASGDTDIDITIPDIVILHYFGNVDITITNAALGTFLTGTAGDSSVDDGIAASTGGFVHDLGIGPNPLTGGDPAAAVLILQNAWAVRSISLAGAVNTQLDIAVGDAVLDHTTTAATITITGAEVDDGTTLGDPITFAAPGLVNPVIGDVQLELDLTAAINAGDYLDGEFTLTATNI